MKKNLLTLVILVLMVALLIPSVSYSQAPLKTLLENWTSSTCGPCASNNPALRTWIEAHGTNLVCVAYHVGWPSPGNDPMYLFNPTQSYDRRYYYGVNAVPEGILQGVNTYIGSPFNWSAMSTLYGQYSGTSVASGVSVVDTRIPPDSNKANITVTNYTALPSGTYYLRVMVVEKWIVYTSPPGSNGETVFENVFRKSLPSSTGTAISTSAGTYNFEFRYKIDPAWKDTSIITIAFIQNDADKTILNTSRHGMVTGIEDPPASLPKEYTLSQNYPNPFNPTTNIKFTLPKDDYVTLKVYDMLGKVVKTVVDAPLKAGEHEVLFDGYNISSGIYFYTIQTSDFQQTKKMILVK